MTIQGAQQNPLVSIILPTYNRAKFLPMAFESIKSQSLQDWELIVVDDGSTDNTNELVAELSRTLPQRVDYAFQHNAGAYPARNTGLDHVRGKYVAFFDSDDLWLPHHLRDCVEGLEKNPEVDWVYAACRVVHYATNKVQDPHTFYVEGKPRPFLSLQTKEVGNLHILNDPYTVPCTILHGLYCGPQNSVIRQTVFQDARYLTSYWNEAEDQLFVLRNLLMGRRFAYTNEIHVVYRIHDDNSSDASSRCSLDRRIDVYKAVARGFEDFGRQYHNRLSRIERRALRHRLGQEYFWHLGYALCWQNGRCHDAVPMFQKGLRLRPLSLPFWKTYLIARVRLAANRLVPN